MLHFPINQQTARRYWLAFGNFFPPRLKRRSAARRPAAIAFRTRLVRNDREESCLHFTITYQTCSWMPGTSMKLHTGAKGMYQAADNRGDLDEPDVDALGFTFTKKGTL